MRALLLALLVAAAGCGDVQHEELTLVTLESPDTLGMSLRELPRATLGSIGLPYGLAVVKVSPIAERSGLRLGDVVYGANHVRFRNVNEFSRAIAQSPQGRARLLVRRGKTDFYVAVDVGPARRPDVLRAPRPATDTLLRT